MALNVHDVVLPMCLSSWPKIWPKIDRNYICSFRETEHSCNNSGMWGRKLEQHIPLKDCCHMTLNRPLNKINQHLPLKV